jgi:hypothetical protein
VLAVALVALAAAPAHAQTMHAVIIGIDDYIEFEDEPGGDLLGAEADARAIESVLTDHWGLEPRNTRMLLGHSATKEAIHDAVTGWLAARVAPGDIAVFYFAGHGAQAYDMDGDEPDALDETIAPADVLPHSSANDIRDDEFRTWLQAVPSQIVVILDSCHSGTATRASGPMRARALDRPLPPEDGEEPKAVRQAPDTEVMADGRDRILELAAAAPNQSAMEGPAMDDPTMYGGVFTRFLVEQLESAPSDATYRDVIEEITWRLEDEDLLQRPQINGKGAGALFRPIG